ncbi:hypothetical protein [Radiobacillus sp. PE A8.2]|uniref:hypothetical protein n=1 Tax=Radiobacillus sp. PE A8.2 TaxID=3380349 RepID=UPI00388D01FD
MFTIFILIEIDKDWTWGIDWGKKSKGVRLGIVAIHICNNKFTHFLEIMSNHYHHEKLKENNNTKSDDYYTENPK